MTSGVCAWRSVSPGCSFWPPGALPDGLRKLLTRAGFLNPSLDGGLPLLELSSPSRRSKSATRGRQSRDLRRLRRNQRNEVFPRRFDRRVPIHRILESETDPAVHENLKATWAVTFAVTAQVYWRSGRLQAKQQSFG